jgi:UDP-glucose 4-epimerase
MNESFTEKFRGRHALISGGLGFIGSNLARALTEAGARVTIVDCELDGSGANSANLAGLEGRIELIRADLRDTGRISPVLGDVNFVFHLAAQTGHMDSMRDPQRDLTNNALGTAALLDACRNSCPRAMWVFASTRQLYGPPRALPVAEEHPLQPPDVNAVGKLCAEELLGVYMRVYGLNAVSLRLTNTYGPGMRVRDARQMFLGLWIGNVLRSRPITVYGDGLQRRDLVFVDDVVEAFMVCADEKLRGRTFNVGSQETIDLRSLAELVRRLGASDSRVEFIDFPADRKAIDIGDYVGDYNSIRAATGWQARTPLERGLTTTIAYYRAQLAAYLEQS